MQLQRQLFLLSYLKTLSVRQAGVELTTSHMTTRCSINWATGAQWHYFGKWIQISQLLTYWFVYIRVSDKFAFSGWKRMDNLCQVWSISSSKSTSLSVCSKSCLFCCCVTQLHWSQVILITVILVRPPYAPQPYIWGLEKLRSHSKVVSQRWLP